MDEQKQPWFGKKRFGFGIRPNTWQGWAITVCFVVLEIVVVFGSHHKYPSWFVAKTSGSGFNPATWQGWVAIFVCPVIFLAIIGLIYSNQRQK